MDRVAHLGLVVEVCSVAWTRRTIGHVRLVRNAGDRISCLRRLMLNRFHYQAFSDQKLPGFSNALIAALPRPKEHFSSRPLEERETHTFPQR